MDIQLIAEKFYDYSKYIRGYAPSTIQRYRMVIQFYCRYTGVQALEEATKKNVREFLLYGRTERQWNANSFITYPIKIQRLLGHTDLRMTDRYLRSMNVDDVRDAVDILDDCY